MGPDRKFAQYSITDNPNASRDRIVYLPNIQSQTTKHPVGANLVFALFFGTRGVSGIWQLNIRANTRFAPTAAG